jgi:hypothetical protein
MSYELLMGYLLIITLIVWMVITIKKKDYSFQNILLFSVLLISILASFKAVRLIMVVAPFLFICFSFVIYEICYYFWSKGSYWKIVSCLIGLFVLCILISQFSEINYLAYCRFNSVLECA